MTTCLMIAIVIKFFTALVTMGGHNNLSVWMLSYNIISPAKRFFPWRKFKIDGHKFTAAVLKQGVIVGIAAAIISAVPIVLLEATGAKIVIIFPHVTG